VLRKELTTYGGVYPVFEPLTVADSTGNLDLEALKRAFPVTAAVLPDFATTACTLLHYQGVLQTWPNTEALDHIARSAVLIITAVHGGTPHLERCKFSSFINQQ
jgi:hypothetical protein